MNIPQSCSAAIPPPRFTSVACTSLCDHTTGARDTRLLGLQQYGYCVDHLHHDDRTHDALQKDAPNHRAVEHQPAEKAVVVSTPRLGGLYHRYSWRQAA